MVSWAYISLPPKRHLDWFSRFCRAHPCAQHIYTDTKITLLVTCAAIGRIYALRAGAEIYKFFLDFLFYSLIFNCHICVLHSVALFSLVYNGNLKQGVALTGRNITGPPSRAAPG